MDGWTDIPQIHYSKLFKAVEENLVIFFSVYFVDIMICRISFLHMSDYNTHRIKFINLGYDYDQNRLMAPKRPKRHVIYDFLY